MQWIRRVDRGILWWCNQRLSSPALDRVFGFITHLGGARFTILSVLFLIVVTSERYYEASIKSMLALIISHIVAVLIKKSVRRARPFRKIDLIRVGKYPLPDYSFPSGHTTAIWAVVTPLILISPPLLMMLLCTLALLVALSRVYWGYHYPLDCVAGGLIGGVTALLVA
ncbi:phosphatase PAP2 family protein [Paenibacillus sp. GCM10027626]|uniref:phosphatase PAP2 family protein n=1 Tax=Paenibacillus sp. GCM10027626 TaxID=3273411 RepID=UPI003644E1B7